ncbi:hypothetical protein BKA62DRAFT_709603 [Auriculariales sp. MPI-PUGE-AT-0066]|nr:hypothetical protein BKA62DRAFT_709603 [Auriculariales sp. MPI-PUGE-AT-0066]
MMHSRVAFAAAAGWLAVVQIGLGNVVVAHGLDDCVVDIMPRLGVPQLGGAIPHRSASVPAHFPTITPLPRETVLLSQGLGPSASGTDAEPAKSVSLSSESSAPAWESSSSLTPPCCAFQIQNPVVIPAHGFQGPVFISSGVRDRFLASYDAVQLARLYALPAGPSWSTEL